MQFTDRPVFHPQVAATQVADQAVVYLADEGEVNVLNPVGTRIWSLIDGTRTVGMIAGAIAAEYEVKPDEAAHDTQAFIQTLVEAHAVTLETAPPGDSK